jgi:hypothetical protein
LLAGIEWLEVNSACLQFALAGKHNSSVLAATLRLFYLAAFTACHVCAVAAAIASAEG